MTAGFSKEYFEEGKGSAYRRGYAATKEQVNIYATLTYETFQKYGKKTSKPRILDIGCAFGYLLGFFDRLGFETFGIDVSSYAIQRCKETTRAKTFICDVQTGTPFGESFFDLITLFDIIEHLGRPLDALSEIYRILKPDGLIILSTPNANSIGRFLLNKKWAGYIDQTHLILYTSYTISLLLERAGFKTIEIKKPQFYPFSTLFKGKLTMLWINNPLGGSIWIVARKKT
ncbi:class I SAM-dependent methyltransferase [Candidatus Bathyarchaeota archaeon]|nr:class I SAM-dependent methyltransferase [Candidatus Bathyarchaeota archaeon]